MPKEILKNQMQTLMTSVKQAKGGKFKRCLFSVFIFLKIENGDENVFDWIEQKIKTENENENRNFNFFLKNVMK